MGGDLDVASIQRAGSSFVLVLSGPTAVDPSTLAAILDRTLDAEHARLQDQGMLRRLQLLGREAAAMRTLPSEAGAAPRPIGTTSQHLRPASRLGHRTPDRHVPLRIVHPESQTP